MMFRLISFVAWLVIAFVFGLQSQSTALASADDLNPPIENARLNVAKPFLQARTHVLKAGWKPVRMHLNDKYEYSGLEHRLAALGFLEFDACSVDAGTLCDFYYRKAGKCLRIDTIGEQVQDMKILHWMHECPPDEQTTQSLSGAPSGK